MSPSPLAPTSPTRPRIGVCLLPEDPWREAADKWRRIEDLGADHGWTYDHLIWGGLPDSPWRSTFPFLTAAAMVTSTLPLRSEEHTSELQSRGHLVCRLLLEKKKARRVPPAPLRQHHTSGYGPGLSP